jgi:alpha-tubulin suppressor-like RCC1 family protein
MQRRKFLSKISNVLSASFIGSFFLGRSAQAASWKKIQSSTGAAGTWQKLAFARKPLGAVQTWGDNGNGQLGDGTVTPSCVPVNVLGISTAVAVSGGSKHTLALLSNGCIMSWGLNANGQLGTNNAGTSRCTPALVCGISTAVAIKAGYNTGFAILADGSLKAWGEGLCGQLGNGSAADRATPVTVTGVTNAVGVATGACHTLVLLANGTVMSWGQNNCGQLGIGTVVKKCTPTLIAGLSNVTQVHVPLTYQPGHSLALLSDGTIKGWGTNGDSELGNTGSSPACTPTAVCCISNAIAVAAVQSNSFALLSDGTIRAWGHGWSSVWGDGSSGSLCSIPGVTVTGISTAIQFGAGYLTMFALLKDGTVKAWGENVDLELGTNTSGSECGVPATICSLTGVAAIGDSAYHGVSI